MWTVNFWMFKLVLEKAEANCQHPLDHRESKRDPEKHLLLLYWLCQRLWLCGSQQTMDNSSGYGNTRPSCLLRNLYGGQEATGKTGHGTMDWFQIAKGVGQGCILSPSLFNLYAKSVMPSHPVLSPSPSTFNLSQHQGLFKWVSSSHQVTKVLEFQLQHQSFQWTFRTDFL